MPVTKCMYGVVFQGKEAIDKELMRTFLFWITTCPTSHIVVDPWDATLPLPSEGVLQSFLLRVCGLNGPDSRMLKAGYPRCYKPVSFFPGLFAILKRVPSTCLLLVRGRLQARSPTPRLPWLLTRNLWYSSQDRPLHNHRIAPSA
jgi:hypothetical protein